MTYNVFGGTLSLTQSINHVAKTAYQLSRRTDLEFIYHFCGLVICVILLLCYLCVFLVKFYIAVYITLCITVCLAAIWHNNNNNK